MEKRSSSSNRYLVISDLHLCDIEEHPDGWKRYKSSQFAPDEELRRLLEAFVEEASEDEELTLILNGDIFDFDVVTAAPSPAPWPVRRLERKYGLDPTEVKSAWKLERILADHPVFVAALAQFAAAGHRLVYVMGNHDREFHFKGVRDALVKALRQAGREQAVELPDAPIRFEPWFYYVPDEIYAEHGQQYDFYCSFRYLLSPTVVSRRGDERLALPMGNLSNRLMLSAMGFFNPHATDYILGGFGYFMHWLRHYAFSRRMLALTWLVGSLRSMFGLIRGKRLLRKRKLDYRTLLAEQAQRAGLEPELVCELEELKEAPITERVFGIIREYWIDRLLIAFLMTGGTIALALTPIPLWIKLMVPLACFPLVYLVYENLLGASDLLDVDYSMHRYARRIARRLPIRVVTFGHTHISLARPMARDVVYANTGSWAPTFDEASKRKEPPLLPGYWNYLVVWFEGGRCHTQLGSRMELREAQPVDCAPSGDLN